MDLAEVDYLAVGLEPASIVVMAVVLELWS